MPEKKDQQAEFLLEKKRASEIVLVESLLEAENKDTGTEQKMRVVSAPLSEKPGYGRAEQSFPRPQKKKIKNFFFLSIFMHRHFPFSVACSCSRRVLWILWGWCVVRRVDSHCLDGGQRLVVVGGKIKSIWISLDVVGRYQGDKVTTRGDKMTTRGDNHFRLR